ncbi:hypothetical protein [Sphingobium sp. CCH11-B1]|jgi:hypothetical protein|uniref:hypothetical protein n=1 Tax=Sphingobium sp. CCH11-B1 TaxID=1768781 RepID=UPI00082E8B8E|nr:hypothetical protein [Sphingobium sp. CCH11-B1]
MSDRHDLIAYLATIAALVLIFALALIVSAIRPDIIGKIEAFGLGTITGGLIGILRIPSARTVQVDQPANDPIPVEPKT